MDLHKINWEDVLIKIVIGITVVFFTGMTFYAMQAMSPKEKTDFILMLQQEQLQE